MKYIYYEFDGSEYYFELNEQHYAIRQVTKNFDGTTLVSSRVNSLAENPVTVDEETDTFLTEKQFNEIWDEQSKYFKEEWEAIKRKYPIGTAVSAEVKYFYPQGIISDIDGVLGITVDEVYTPEEIMLYPGDVLDGFVSGYDEESMWLKFESSK